MSDVEAAFDVAAEYKALRAAEAADDLKASESARMLLERLAGLGFPDYATFMTTAAAEEIRARSESMRRPSADVTKHFSAMLAALSRVRDNGQRILSGFDSIGTTPMNMRIQAAHLGDRAAPIAVISSSYDGLFGEIRTGIAEFLERSDNMFATINTGLFLTCVSRLQQDVIAQFDAETDTPAAIDKGAECALLNAQTAGYRSDASAGLRSIVAEIEQFAVVCDHLRRVLSGLSLTRILCQIESSRIGEDAQNIGAIASQLEAFQVSTNDCLQAIQHEYSALSNNARKQMAARAAA